MEPLEEEAVFQMWLSAAVCEGSVLEGHSGWWNSIGKGAEAGPPMRKEEAWGTGHSWLVCWVLVQAHTSGDEDVFLSVVPAYSASKPPGSFFQGAFLGFSETALLLQAGNTHPCGDAIFVPSVGSRVSPPPTRL